MAENIKHPKGLDRSPHCSSFVFVIYRENIREMARVQRHIYVLSPRTSSLVTQRFVKKRSEEGHAPLGKMKMEDEEGFAVLEAS